MKHFLRLPASGLLLLLAVVAWGCASKPQTDWGGRIGSFSYDAALRELGAPHQLVTQPDGGKVADWLLRRGTPGSPTHAVWRRPDISTAGVSRNAQLGPEWKKSRPATPDRLLRLTFAPDARLADWAKVERMPEERMSGALDLFGAVD